MARVETLLKTTTYLCALTGFAAVVQYIELAYVAGFSVLALLAALTEYKIIASYPRWSLNLSSLLVLIPSLLRIGPDFLVSPVLEGLVLLMAIKLLEEKKSRDYMQVYLISVFLLIGSTLMSFSIVFLFYFFVIFMLSTLSLMLLACFSHDPNLLLSKGILPRLFSQALLICIFSIPACALLFIVFPRADFPLFGFMNKAVSARSGFSDSVSLGDVSEIQEDSSVVFRAAMDEISDPGLYWRGVELDQFDGASWKRSARDKQEETPSLNRGRETVQTLYLEPYGNRYLFALDHPVAIYPEKGRRWRKPENVWSETINQRIRYRAVSVSTDFVSATLTDHDKYVRLPPGFSPRIAMLAREVIEEGGNTDSVRSLMKFFRSGKYEYSLKNLPSSDFPLEEFIFNSKRGNCEYFASALAVMLRSVGIPARVIGGYRGGYYNHAGKYYLVLQKNAHVWVEAYDSGGWRRLDPTPFSTQNPGAYQSGLFLQLRILLDTFNYYWDRFVINYDLSDQFAIWGKVKSRGKMPPEDFVSEKVGFQRLVEAVPVLAAIPLIFFLVCRLRRRPEQKLAAKFLRRMVKRGYKKGAAEGLEEFVGRVGEPELKMKAEEFVAGFQNVFYRDREFSAEEIKRLKSRIRQM